MMTDTNYVPPSANVDDISLARASTVLSASGTTTNLLLKRKNTNDTADICLYLDEDIENVDELADAMDMASNMASVADGTQPAGSAIVHRKRARGERVPWLPEEDNLLRLAVQLYGYNTDKWTKISACVPGRTNKHCRKRWFHSLDPSRRKGPWTQKEDLLLREAHAHFGEQWSRVAELVPGRTDDQCSKRWRESLDPAIDRSEWTDAEDQDLLRLVGEFGSQWQRIAEYFPGRPGLHCRNRWRKLCRSINPFKHLRNGRGMPDAAAIIAGLDIDSLTSDNNNNASAILDATAHHNDNVQDSFIEDRQWMSMFDGDDDQREYERGDGKDDDEDTDEDIRAELARQMAVRSSPTGNIVPNNNASTTDAIHMTTNTAHSETLIEEEASYREGEGQTMTTEAYGCAYPDCNAVFTVPHALLYHFKRCHIGQAAPLERPFRCAMPGCLKRYKNLNGIQYHVERAKGSVGHTYSVANSSQISAKDQHNLRGQNTALNSGPFNVNVFPMSDNYATVTATAAAATTVEENKPFRCAVPGCPKAYRNPNGLEYHMRHAHLDLMPASLVDEITARRPRPFRCTSKGCGRRYMSPNGLHYHIRNMHPEQEDELMSSLRNQSAQPSSSQNSQSTKHQGNILVWRQEKST